MEMSTRYTPQEVEDKIYDHWMEKGYFHSEPDEREAFSIVIPPPNVTGVLHMGHMLNNTIQDILIRRARKEGKNACWVPGTDHASIATEAKVVRLLREQGIKKGDLSREDFLKHAFDWKDKYGGIILDQLKRLGASCDWERTRFTMEPKLSDAVVKVFVDLFRKGKIYRGLRMTNWDPVAQTVLSNEEVIHTEEQSNLYHIRYQIVGTDDYLVIATQRPETIMADAAVAVHPDDERYTHLIGKSVIIPLINREIPVIADDYVDMEFGTAALKVTPAHDTNDHEIGERHNLPVIDILNADGTLNEKAEILVGEDRFEARISIKKLLKEAGALVELEQYRTSIGRSERTDAVVEPRLTLQWFMKMDDFAKTALKAVESDEVTFHPEHFFNMYNNWLKEENVRDWCISRQLWWGQQIPAWYIGAHVFVAETEAEALAQAQKELGAHLTVADLQRDEDVVDTWFSSWLWPMSVFDAFEGDAEEFKYYYPTSVLVTGWDIIFFWVARMVMAGYEWAPELLGPKLAKEKGIMPFKDVFFTGMVRDQKRRKMSKSLGNSPDALELINNYGADGVRFGMLSSASAGNDIIFDAPIDPATGKALNESKLCEQGRNFCNKMWQALRLIKSFEIDEQLATSEGNEFAVLWINHKLAAVQKAVLEQMDQFRFADAIMQLYAFIWGDFCSWYLELIKPEYGQPIDRKTIEATEAAFAKMMSLLHPFMPFITEEIWQLLKTADQPDCAIAQFAEVGAFDQALIDQVEKAKELVSKIRETRIANGISPKEALPLLVEDSASAKALLEEGGVAELVKKLAALSELRLIDASEKEGIGFLSGTEKYYLVAESQVNAEEEIEKLEEEIKRLKGFVTGIEKKLGNERFVNNAPDAVVDRERKKLADGQEKIKILETQLANYQ